MTYQVLARKWRPRDFSQMVGQGHVLKALVNALDTQRLHHAYLFTGTRGVGKTSIARVLAKALNCEVGISSKPCGNCASCREVDEGRFVDLIEVDAATRTKVEDTRDLLENVQYAPARGRFKVYLIDEVHMFSSSSFNALLKTLEEPPPHVKFLLATTDPKKLPITVLSRCLQFNLKRLSPEQIRDQLKRILEVEGIAAEAGALELVATAADGSLRDSLSLLDQAIAFTNGRLETREVASMLGTVATEQVLPLVEALAAGDGPALLLGARQLAEYAPDFAQILGEILSILRRIAVCQTLGAEAETLEENAQIKDLAGRLHPEDCQLYYQLGLLGRRDLPLAPEPLLGFEMALLRMHAFRPDAELPAAVPQASATGRTGTRGALAASDAVSVARQAHASTAAAPAPAVTPSPGGQQGPRMDEEGVASKAPVAAPMPGARSSGTGESSAPENSHASDQPAPVTAADWAEVVASMQTTGLVREFARHCAFVRMEGGDLELALSPQAENLRSDRQVKALELALGRHFGRALRLRLVRGGVSGAMTPAQALSEAEAARREAATRQIADDPNVHALQRQFGATVERVDPTDS